MKKFSLRAFALVLVLSTQIFAQRFIAEEPTTFVTGFNSSNTDTGYIPTLHQIAVLGEKNSSYANLMLVGGRDTRLVSYDEKTKVCSYNVINSYGNVFGTVYPLNSTSTYTTLSNNVINDNCTYAALVLDSLSDNKKSATVLFSAQKRMSLVQISIDNANNISFNIIRSINLPESMWQMYSSTSSSHIRRLALVGVTKTETDKIYNLVTGNPYGTCGTSSKCGRVDFFSISESSWTIFQLNTKGLASGENGFFLSENTNFGTGVAVIDNLDNKGGKGLAVIMPSSNQYPNSAIYIFSMDNDWTPNEGFPVIITGNSTSWLEDPDATYNCGGISAAPWQDENPHLLISCSISKGLSSTAYLKEIAIKGIALNSNGSIANSYTLFSKYSSTTSVYSNFSIGNGPVTIKNHKNDLHAVSFSVSGPAAYSSMGSMMTFPVIDVDYSKNFSVEAGKSETIVKIDSLFYNSGTTGYFAKTFFGLVKCEIKNKDLICSGEENAIGSWSGVELSSSSACDPYKACKRKDTIFVYVRSQKESSNTALRISKNILVPYFGQTNLSNIKSRSYFKNPNLQNTNISWNTTGLKLSAVNGNLGEELSIIPFSQREGIDTLVFNLSLAASVDNYPIGLHVADTSKILNEKIPANKGNDTIWNTSVKKYIALPLANSNGNIYTYDIMQNSLGAYAEIVGDYLHILKVDVAEINLAYTENSEINMRKIILMPEAKPLPLDSSNSSGEQTKETEPPSSDSSNKNPDLTSVQNFSHGNLKAFYAKGGLQIDGINENLDIRVYNLKGSEIQREKISTKGSVFVRLNNNCPQIVQISTPNKKSYISIFPTDGISRYK